MWELSNVIKIHAGVLHILLLELTGRSASNQALPLLCLVRIDRGYWAMQGGLQSACPVPMFNQQTWNTDWSRELFGCLPEGYIQ